MARVLTVDESYFPIDVSFNNEKQKTVEFINSENVLKTFTKKPSIKITPINTAINIFFVIDYIKKSGKYSGVVIGTINKVTLTAKVEVTEA